ncbi:MAG: hypothetical protein M3Z05_09775 [Gemmatimonadota bacterium]|nr:hypothetical protein [Gemmatimonadota bacterium]
MTDERRFGELFTEMTRVGIDPHRFPAGVAVEQALAVQILRVLPDGAGPEAFLTAVREEQQIIRANTGPDGVARA